MSEWIDRKDRLPDKTGYYVVWTERGGLEIAWYEDRRFSMLITHWRKGELCRPKPKGPFYACRVVGDPKLVFNQHASNANATAAQILNEADGRPFDDNLPALVEWLNKIWAQHKP